MHTDSASNGGPPSNRFARAPHPGSSEVGVAVRREKETVEALTVALGRLRRGAAALKAENNQLRAEVAAQRPKAADRSGGAVPAAEVGQLAEIELPSGPLAPGAARMVIDHCLSGLVAPRVLADARLLTSELVTNSISHGDLECGTVVLRMDLTAQTLRLEIENTGTAGVVASRTAGRQEGSGGYGLELVDLLSKRWGIGRDHNTRVWLEMGRA
jgi:anti-sigma regulatory factor (Ser/Thr protein kinase)